jgi:hypothetical protein
VDLTQQVLASRGFAMPDENAPNQYGDIGDLFVQGLRGIVNPKHQWGLIYVLSVMLLLLLGPGNLLVGRKVRDYRWSILFLLAIVGLFSYVFFHTGRRGYGEASTVTTICYARQIDAGAYDLTHWTNVFVTSGDTYDIQHQGSQYLYSTVHFFESVKGTIDNGANGVFRVDMPLYSNREFIARGRVTTKPIIDRVEELSAGSELEKLSVRVGPGFPAPPHDVWVMYHNELYACTVQDGRIALVSKHDALDEDAARNMLMWGLQYGAFYGNEDDDPQQREQQMFTSARDLLIMRERQRAAAGPTQPHHRDSVQLFIYADLPDEMKITSTALGREHGRVLYHIRQPLFIRC